MIVKNGCGTDGALYSTSIDYLLLSHLLTLRHVGGVEDGAGDVGGGHGDRAQGFHLAAHPVPASHISTHLLISTDFTLKAST